MLSMVQRHRLQLQATPGETGATAVAALTAGQDWPSPDIVGDSPVPRFDTAAGAGADATSASKPCAGLDGGSADGRRREEGTAAHLPVMLAGSCNRRTL